MSEDSQQVGLDEIIEQNDKSDVSVNLHPHIRQLGIEVPDGWVAVSLGEIGQLDTSSVDKKSNSGEKKINLVNYMDVYEKYRINSNIDYMEVTAPDSHIERSQVRPGDILFTPSSEEPRDIGNSAVVTEEMERTLHSYHTVRLRPTSDSIQLDTGFSGWLANAPYVAKQFARRATGSTRYTLTLGDFSDTQVLIPPLPEQRKIATVLYTVDRAIEKTEEIIGRNEKLKKGLRRDIFQYGGLSDEKTTTRRIGPKEYEMPEDWEVTNLSQVAEIKGGQGFKSSNYVEEGVPLIKISNVQNGYLDLQDTSYLPEEYLHEYSDVALSEGDVVLVLTRPIIGDGIKAARIDKNDRFLLNQRLAVVDPVDENTIAREYLYHLIFTNVFIDQVKATVRATHQPNLSKTDLQNFSIPVPGIEQQRRVCRLLGSVEDVIEKNKSYRSNLKRMKRGLMQDLLSGTVQTTNANIEVPDEIEQHG